MHTVVKLIFLILFAAMVAGLPGAGRLQAAELTVVVRLADSGAALADAVVTVSPQIGKASLPRNPSVRIIDQINKTFVPHVVPVVVGTPVFFPNKDDIRHHIYSFDEAKTFEVPLYSGTPANPVVFDMPGVVRLGCNIHDWMAGYIYIVETPWFARSDGEGKLSIEGIPAGKYFVNVWHPQIMDADTYKQGISLKETEVRDINFSIGIKPIIIPKRRVRSHSGGY